MTYGDNSINRIFRSNCGLIVSYPAAQSLKSYAECRPRKLADSSCKRPRLAARVEASRRRSAPGARRDFTDVIPHVPDIAREGASDARECGADGPAGLWRWFGIETAKAVSDRLALPINRDSDQFFRLRGTWKVGLTVDGVKQTVTQPTRIAAQSHL